MRQAQGVRSAPVKYRWYMSAVDGRVHAFPIEVADDESVEAPTAACGHKVNRSMVVRRFVPPVCAVCPRVAGEASPPGSREVRNEKRPQSQRWGRTAV